MNGAHSLALGVASERREEGRRASLSPGWHPNRVVKKGATGANLCRASSGEDPGMEGADSRSTTISKGSYRLEEGSSEMKKEIVRPHATRANSDRRRSEATEGSSEAGGARSWKRKTPEGQSHRMPPDWTGIAMTWETMAHWQLNMAKQLS